MIKINYLTNKGKAVVIFLFLLLCMSIYMVFFDHPPDDVISVPQKQIETPAGVQAAAHQAGYNISSDQSKQIAHSVKEIHDSNYDPDYTVYTTGTDIEQDSEKARQENKADFSLISDPDNPEKAIDIKKLDEKNKINLNQYNIKAYPKIIRQISYGKNITNGSDTVGLAISRKISKNGKYLGVGIEQEIGHDHSTMIKIIYSW